MRATERIIHSTNGALSRASRPLAFLADQQGGVGRENQENGGEFVASATVHNRIAKLLGITEFAAELRTQLTREENPDHDLARGLLGDSSQLLTHFAEIQAKAQLLTNLLESDMAITHRKLLQRRLAAWQSTITGVVHAFCPNEGQQIQYQELFMQQQEELQQPGVNGKASYKDRLHDLLEDKRAVSRIKHVVNPEKGGELAEEVMDEFLENAWAMNALRVLKIIEAPLSPKARAEKLLQGLEFGDLTVSYREFVEQYDMQEEYEKYRKAQEALVSSSLEPEERVRRIAELRKNFTKELEPLLDTYFSANPDHDGEIDIPGIRQQVADLQVRAQEIKTSSVDTAERERQLTSLDEQLQALLIPVINKVAAAFPHEKSTNLSDVLENQDAICAGKVNVLLAVTKYLGINARANTVVECLDGRDELHVCLETDLFSSDKLVIDGNFFNNSKMENYTDDQLFQRAKIAMAGGTEEQILQRKTYYREYIIPNARYIPRDAKVFTYRIHNTGEVTDMPHFDANAFKAIRINPISGKREVWESTVPSPHRVNAPDKDGYYVFNSAVLFNNKLAGWSDRSIGLYLTQKMVEASPYDPKSYYEYMLYLSPDEAIALFENIKNTNPDFFWQSVYNCQVWAYMEKGAYDKAFALKDEVLARNSSIYSADLNGFTHPLRQPTDEMRPAIISYLTKVRKESPELFFQSAKNVSKLDYLLIKDSTLTERINLLEDYQHYNPEGFWQDTAANFLGWKKLADLYAQSYLPYGQNTADANETVLKQKQLLREIEIHHPDLYIGGYLLTRYLYLEKMTPEAEVTYMNALLQEHPTAFYSYPDNVKQLTRGLKGMGMKTVEERIAVLQEMQSRNPNGFWNELSIYSELANLLIYTDRVEEALAIAQQAQIEDGKFWKSTTKDGYALLASLYNETGREKEAIDIILHAREQNPNFFDNSSLESGYLLLASIYQQHGRLDEAIAVVLEAETKDKYFWEYASHWQSLADLYMAKGNYTEALAIYETVKVKNPKSYWEGSYYRIIDVYEKLGKQDEGQEVLDEIISTFEESISHVTKESAFVYRDYLLLARAFERRGLPDDLIKSREYIAKIFNGSDVIVNIQNAALQFIASLSFKEGNREQAIGYYSQLMKNAESTSDFGERKRVIQETAKRGISLSELHE